MKLHSRPAVAFAGLVLVAGLAGTTAPAWAAASSHQARTAAAVPAAGTGHAVAHVVSVPAAAAGPQIAVHASSLGTLGRDGKPAGATLPARASTGVTSPLASPASRAGGPNGGLAARARPSAVPFTPPTTINANFQGIVQGSSNCGLCQPPDVNAAVSTTEIAHVVNLRLQVYNKAGGLLCGVGLNTLAGTSESLSDPRIQYNNVYNQFSMVFIPVPASNIAPAEYLLTSVTSDACGSWFVYRMTFAGPSFPAGTLLDYPYLGQDNVPSTVYPTGGAILSSTNNFCCASNGFASYIGSTAFAIPAYPAYHGLGFSFPAFSVAFSTAPVTVAGIPMFATANTYWLASVPGSGYDLYVMTHSSQAGTTMALQAAIASAFSAPSRRVIQPGTAQTLDPLDGRIVWAPVQDGNFVWFTHGIDLVRGVTHYPSVRYGAIGVATSTAFVALAYHSATSDDFNPSIGVSDAGGGLIHAWLNWAYTDTPAGRATSDTLNGVLPGQGVPNEIGTDLTVVIGSPTASNFRFGDFSSVEVDPSSGGLTAVSAQEYFTSSGLWTTRIVRSTF